jgi:uncharacterized protein (TIGR02117 family)
LIRWLLHGLAALIALPILYLCAALLGAVIPGETAEIGGVPALRIALARGPIHYDLLLPLTDATRRQFIFAAAQGVPVLDRRAKYLIVGWGARDFYTTTGSYADLALPSVWRAATGDRATLHLDVAGDLDGVPNLTWLPLSEGQLAALTTRITASLDRDPAGNPVLLPVRYGLTDAFFAAKGDFHLFHTCNAWLGETLRAAGIRFGWWTPTPHAVTLSAWWFSPARS